MPSRLSQLDAELLADLLDDWQIAMVSNGVIWWINADV